MLGLTEKTKLSFNSNALENEKEKKKTGGIYFLGSHCLPSSNSISALC